MRKRRHMDLAAWRAAAERDELWIVDQPWAENAPDGLTDREWGQHIAARFNAKTGNVQKTLLTEFTEPLPVGSL